MQSPIKILTNEVSSTKAKPQFSSPTIITSQLKIGHERTKLELRPTICVAL